MATPHNPNPTPGSLPGSTPVKPYSNALMSSLIRIVGQWSAPDFLTAVVAREGLLLDPGSITVITLLAGGGPWRPSGLARQMVTGPSNVSKILARLTTNGIVERIPDPADARANLITLTPAGTAVANTFVQAGDSLVDELLTGWDDTERHDLVRLLGKLERSTTALSAQLRSAQPLPAQTPPESTQPQATRGDHQ